MIRFINRFPGLKRLLLSLLNWHTQTLGRSPDRWPTLPSELLWFRRSLSRYRRLARNGYEKIHVYPILLQRAAMPVDFQYLYQAAWATYLLTKMRPIWHADVSSDLRFVSQLSALFPVTYIEYRPPRINLTNISTIHGSLTNLPFADHSIPSLSCLHVVEHIGLGRYGDPVDPQGYRHALHELQRTLAVGGYLFLSVPIGQPRTLFNAHRIFAPACMPSLLPELTLEEFSAVTTSGKFEQSSDPARHALEEYACGLYLFRRTKSP